ncbi:MAG TPA: PQQ-dependent sugar dehydrogenase [Candidatus Limnocylindrales bacterium]
MTEPRRVPAAAPRGIAIAAVAAVVFVALASIAVQGPGPTGTPGAGSTPAATATAPTSAAATSPAGSATASGGPASSAGAAFDPNGVRLALRQLASGLDRPVFVTGAGDASGRLFVVEQTGRIRIVRDGRILPSPFLDLSGSIVCCGEQGLLGLAFHPRYADDGRFYVYYTANDGTHDVTIAEYRRSASDPDVADPASGRILVQVAHDQAANHDGGMLAFGPDGRLYAGLGDGGGAGGQFGTTRDLGTLLAKLIRLDVDHPAGGLPYGTHGNPFVDRSGARPEIWAWGLRNPWRFSFDRATGELWIGDVGQDRWEEIDRAPAGVGGQDYGWNVTEGFHCFAPASGCPTAGITFPVAEYGHDQGCAVVGGYVYRGSASPALRGGYLFGDDCSGRIWGLVSLTSGRQTPVLLLASGLAISSFGEGDTGELYVADLRAGAVYSISATRG